MNGPKRRTPCGGCGKACSIGMIGNLAKWLCWTCSR